MNLGIDLGTSNSAIAGMDGTNIRIFKTPMGNDYLPSVIYMDRRGNRLYGQQAYNQSFMSPENSASGFKRMMGTKESYDFRLANLTLSPEECSAEVLKQLIGQACTEMGRTDINGTIITIPAAFNQMQTEATLRAARLAGIEQVALLQEPVAAAMAAMADGKRSSSQFLIYDLGGGTFDLALVQSHNGVISILAHEGINMCGGRNIDTAIANAIVRPWLQENFSLAPDFQKTDAGKRLIRMCLFAAEQAKIQLSKSEAAIIVASEEQVHYLDQEGEEVYLQVEITRRQLEMLAEEQVEQTIALSRKILKENGYSREDIDRLVFIGGPTKMPCVRDYVPAQLGIPADLDIDPMTAVAVGAAIYCESREWGERESRRKLSRASLETKGTFRICLDYTARTEGDRAKIKISTQDGTSLSGHEVEMKTQTGVTTGRIHLQEGLNVEVPLDDIGDNYIHIYVYDGAGKPVAEATQQIIVTRVLSTISGIPATQPIAVKVLEREGSTKNKLHRIIEKGTTLPSSGTYPFRAARPLKAGEVDYLQVELYQDEGVPEVDLNLHIGSFRITGSELPEGSQIRVGDPILLKWYMSDSGLISAEVELSEVGQTFKKQVWCPGYQGSTPDDDLDKALDELDELERAVGESAAEVVDRLRESLYKQELTLEEATSKEDERGVAESLRHVRQEISRVRHAPQYKRQVLTQRLIHLQASYNKYIRPFADERLNEVFDHHCIYAQKALAKGDERALREAELHLDGMEGAQGQFLLQDLRFLTKVFEDRCGKASLAIDKQEFERLLHEGRQAIALEDTDALRMCIFRMNEILASAPTLDADMSRLASLMLS